MTTLSKNASTTSSTRPVPLRRAGRALRNVLRLATGTVSGRFGVAAMAVILIVVIVGPFLAPYGITEVVGRPFAPLNATYLLGTDYLGRDVLSRFLHGGATLIMLSLLAPLISLIIGGLVGTLAGSIGGRVDLVITWIVDVVLSLPSMILALLILASLGTGPGPSLVALTVVLVPGAIRVARAATLDAASSDYVEAALARGESRLAVAVREILPNTRSVLAADFGARVGYAALIYAGLSFLGVGQSPPAADWGLMINENRIGLLIQPIAVVVPAIAIALFTVSVSTVSDSIARSVGGRTR
ncbi:ABC transporter permease [Pseudarthrobacter siccitolerans]